MKHTLTFPTPTLIPVNGIELEVFEAGQEHRGNPIILCHGWPEHAFSWRHQIPALAAAGYHVIVPNQRGYGNSSCPVDVEQYDIANLSGDLTALLDHFGYEKATFVGHDWGAAVVWGLTLLHPERVDRIINLALPYQERGDMPWIEMMAAIFGSDHYFVHFNRQPGVADDVLNKNPAQFLNNLFRKNVPVAPPEPGMMMINIAQQQTPPGEPILSEQELAVFASAFEATGFTGGINWYRNLDRNWHLLAKANPVIQQATLMIHGNQDMIPQFDRLTDFVPNAEVATLNCGHWIQQELPEETNQLILHWLKKR